LTYRAKIKIKFVSPYPTDPVKIGRLKFFIGNLLSLFFFFSLKIRFAENSLSSQKNCISAQVNATLGLKFVEYVIPGKKSNKKLTKRTRTGIQINGHPVAY